MTPSEIEQTIGDFYGLHLQESGYHGNPAVAWLQRILKSLKISERRLEEMVCMEAGGAGNKALALAQMDLTVSLGLEPHGLEARSTVRTVTERLVPRAATGTPVILLAAF